jgi:multisubunit Na+/H+ antiporter MnhC subunit
MKGAGPSISPVHWLLLGVSLVAAVPRLYLGATQYIEYDGYWHVFIATQDDWQQFYQEYHANFHPPLFYLLMKAVLWFGRTPLVYRSISLLTGVAAVFVTGKIAERFSLNRYTPVVAALAYGVALPSIIISCEVRSYMLSVFFLLVSFYYFLDFQGPGEAPRKSRAFFALSAIFAGYSHYGAFLYIGACAVTAVLFDLFLFRRKFWARLAQDAATFGTIAAALAYVYLTHARFHAVVAEHLNNRYFRPGHESLWGFLTRNSYELLNLFSPFPVANGTPFYLGLAALIPAGVCFVYLIRRLSQTENVRAAATVLASAVLLSIMVAGGVLGKYPYGGDLRQQFFLFPFTVLCGCILLDRIAAALRPKVASALMLSAAVAAIASGSFAFAQYPKIHTELGTAQMNRFRKDFPSPAAVYVDDFNLINFFIHYHDWRWQFVGHSQAVPLINIYRVSRATQSFLLLRDRSRWNLDFGEQALFTDMAKCIRAQQLPSLTVFYTRQQAQPVPIQQESAHAVRLLAHAAAASLCVSKVEIEGLRVYAELRAGQCGSDIGPLMKCSKCDDTSWSIDYSGNWQRGEYDQASNATLTYTDDPAASARFSFEGTELRYVYTKAFNRGFAAISIDGMSKGAVDLYSPTIEWQSSSVFGGLPPGHHTLEIRATGRHNPESTGFYIDIDALQAQ